MPNCQRAIEIDQGKDFRCGDGNRVWLTQFASNFSTTTSNYWFNELWRNILFPIMSSMLFRWNHWYAAQKSEKQCPCWNASGVFSHNLWQVASEPLADGKGDNLPGLSPQSNPNPPFVSFLQYTPTIIHLILESATRPTRQGWRLTLASLFFFLWASRWPYFWQRQTCALIRANWSRSIVGSQDLFALLWSIAVRFWIITAYFAAIVTQIALLAIGSFSAREQDFRFDNDNI